MATLSKLPSEHVDGNHTLLSWPFYINSPKRERRDRRRTLLQLCYELSRR